MGGIDCEVDLFDLGLDEQYQTIRFLFLGLILFALDNHGFSCCVFFLFNHIFDLGNPVIDEFRFFEAENNFI